MRSGKAKVNGEQKEGRNKENVENFKFIVSNSHLKEMRTEKI